MHSIIIWVIRMLQTQKTRLTVQIVDFTQIEPECCQFQELAYFTGRFYQYFHLKTEKYGKIDTQHYNMGDQDASNSKDTLNHPNCRFYLDRTRVLPIQELAYFTGRFYQVFHLKTKKYGRIDTWYYNMGDQDASKLKRHA